MSIYSTVISESLKNNEQWAFGTYAFTVLSDLLYTIRLMYPDIHVPWSYQNVETRIFLEVQHTRDFWD
jgi:hypothetical protein